MGVQDRQLIMENNSFNSVPATDSAFGIPSLTTSQYTRRLGDHQMVTLNEINYICTSTRWRSSLLDMCVHRNADVGLYHHLLVGKVHLGFKKWQTPQRVQPFTIIKLRDSRVAINYESCTLKQICCTARYHGIGGEMEHFQGSS